MSHPKADLPPDDALPDDGDEAELLPTVQGLEEAAAPASVRRGAEVIREHWKTLPMGPGVYRMLGGEGEVLYLGKEANELAVKGADLSRYRIVAFSTHGLLPGDLNGLTQPALALTAPKVAGIEGDGLLTMEEILALKLDADWVVLSACNTGAGTSSGAEALSGLGRAFFYAGTRSLLITNWSVDTQSARELISDLFRRQATDPQLSRGEALRQAAMALVDGGGFSENGKMLYSYAHPLFWAPYSVIGEGGGG